MIKYFNISCLGERHKEEGTLCEDYSYSTIREDIAISIVCDGHGAKEYFRSSIGAKIAAEVTIEAILGSIKNTDMSILTNKSFNTFGSNEGDELLEDNSYMFFRKLFTSIIYLWEKEVNAHAINNPITDEETKFLSANERDSFNNGIFMDIAYGTTLLTYVQTPYYWFAFQIGDGKIISIDTQSKWIEPIKEDKKCHDNITTSLCDFDAINEFRFCYQGDGKLPHCVFLCSDGLENSFKSTDKLVDFYKSLLIDMPKLSKETIIRGLTKILPSLSKLCSQDDISISCIYNDENRPSLIGI